MFKLSGILAIVFCGLIMRKYVDANIAVSSVTTVKYTMKTLSSMCESIIFLFLGLSTVVDTHKWNTSFTLFSLLFCLVYRAVGILVAIPLMNRYRLDKLDKVDMFVLIYGGLRGAISFSLALLLDEKVIGTANKRMFLTTTTAIVIFTSFFQGLTIRPLVTLLRVKKAEAKNTDLGSVLYERVIDYVLLGVEDIMGTRGRNRIREKFQNFEARYLAPYLMKNVPKARDNKLIEVCKKLNYKEANAFIQQYGGDLNALKADLRQISKPAPSEFPEFALGKAYLDPHAPSDKWHHLMGEIIHKRAPRTSRYSRHMLFDENEPSSPDLSAVKYRYQTTNVRTPRPIIETSGRHKSHLKKPKKRHGGIGDTIRRFSVRILGTDKEDETGPKLEGGNGRVSPERRNTTDEVFSEDPAQTIRTEPKLGNVVDQIRRGKRVGFTNFGALADNTGDDEPQPGVSSKYLKVPGETNKPIPTITLNDDTNGQVDNQDKEHPSETQRDLTSSEAMDDDERRYSLTLAEKTLPWKIPTQQQPVKMTAPLRKLSDVYQGLPPFKADSISSDEPPHLFMTMPRDSLPIINESLPNSTESFTIATAESPVGTGHENLSFIPDAEASLHEGIPVKDISKEVSKDPT